MNRSRFSLLVIAALLLLTPITVSAAKINFPDILDYKTLKCDFHMHTVFSDGSVWPTVRVDEAVREGLDMITITDHIEYQPKKADIPTNHNRPFQIAKGLAEKRGLLIALGAEITRSTPPGHFNAIFLDNVEPVDKEEFLDAMKAANAQNAFVFWNHPDWKKDHIGWFDIHTTLFKEKLFQGIEVCNGGGYHLNGHKWAIEKNLTMMGNSDIHRPSLITETTPENHRTITLVFAEEKTVEAVKEALIDRRTAVWYKDQLIARPKYLLAMFQAAVKTTSTQKKGRRLILELTNNCDLNLRLARTGKRGPEQILLPAMQTTKVKYRLPRNAKSYELDYTVQNMLVAPEKGLAITLTGSAD